MKNMHVYAHTHWDYEWYFSANESIIQLIYHMDEVIMALCQGILKTYVVDSQVSILEEYLSFMPQKTDIVKKLVKNGQLMIGPWYTQSDELIISGECLVRNLWYGMHYADSLGKCMKIGYLPDSFGQSKDMPKLYQGFDIKDALFWRGMPKDLCEQREFMWKSMDGSTVLTYNIQDGYFYGGNLIYTDDVSMVEERLLQHAKSKNQLLPVGGDQRYVDFNLKERIVYYNAHTTHDIKYMESDLELFYKELRKEDNFKTIEGEFIDASVSKIHHSIYSTRYDHKVLNDKIERRMLYQIEPFMVMQQMIEISPKISILERIWKKILLNHAHDSACGCNSDKTNASILQRLQDCDQMSTMLLDYQVRKVSESLKGIQTNDFILYNTLPYTRMINQEYEVSTKQEGFIILDVQGKEVPYDTRLCVKEYGGSIRKDTSTYDKDLFYYKHKIRMCVCIAPMSMQIFHIKECKKSIQPCLTNQTYIENEYYRITLEEGALCLYDKHKKKTLHDFLYIQDSGDDGDSYDYSDPQKDVIFDLRFLDAKRVLQKGLSYESILLTGAWKLPYQLYDRIHCNNEKPIPYKLEILLDHTNVIKCSIVLDNHVIEHRMRVMLRHDINKPKAVADTLFGSIIRENRPKHMKDWREQGYREEPSPIYPMLHHVSVKDTESCTVYGKGIKEYEVVKDKLALTLFRSVRYLGKPDLKRRPGVASGNEFQYIETPNATVLKEMTFTFGVSYDNNYDALQVHKTWLSYATAFLYYQMQEMNRFVNTQKYFVTHPYQNELTPITSFLNLDKMENAVFSSCMPIDDTSFALRIFQTRWNVGKEEHIGVAHIKRVEETNLLLHTTQSVLINEHSFSTGTLKAEEIKTYKITKK